MTLLLATFGIGVASALIPVVNIELYLVGLGARADPGQFVALATVAGLGQTLGKVVWYEVARRGIETERARRLLERKKLRPAFDRWTEKTTGRPVYAGLVLAASSVTGFPPLLALAVVAGGLRTPRPLFISVVLVGRVVRFYALVAGVGWTFTPHDG